MSNSTTEIQPGSIVRLKTGSPLMTVEKIFHDSAGDEAQATWFTDNDSPEHRSEKFAVAALNIASLPESVTKA